MRKIIFLKKIVSFMITVSFVCATCYGEEKKSGNDKGVQKPASEGGGFQQIGQMVGAAGLGVSIAGAMGTCPNPSMKVKCRFWIAGAVASAGVIAAMMMAKKKSGQSESDSSVDGAQDYKNKKITTNNDKTDDGLNLDKDTQDNLDKLARTGHKINLKDGTWTDPDGKKWNSDMFSSPQAMSNAGMSDKDIADFKDVMQQLNKHNKDATGKGIADKADDSGTSSVGVASNSGGAGSGFSEAPKIGINRNPNQVNGMAKLYNGEKIGVSGDSLFDMMNRRYKLHSERGSFIDNSLQK